MQKFLITILMLAFFMSSCQEPAKEKRVLVFSKTEGYRHQSIPKARDVLADKLTQKGIKVDTTENAAYFVTDSLKKYSAVIFLMTTGDVLDYRQQVHFERYIQAGGGYAGIHSAVDTEYHWPWYGKLAGAYFSSHPKQQTATIRVKDKNHPSTSHLPDDWERFDEWYNFKNLNPATTKLAWLDESTYEGGTNGDQHPFAWYHEFEGGRAFYTAGGHTDESYEEPLFLDHVIGGIEYAIGDNQLDYQNATTELVPESNRFLKQVLTDNLDEPLELEVLRNGKVVFIERKGLLKMYDPEQEVVREIAKLNVFTGFEDGLIGMALDPDYEKNHWIYLYYSAPEKWVNRLSRFVFIADSLLMNTEKQLLEVEVQRESCCHTGGSIEFGPDGLLYLSTGDDTSPFNNKNLTFNSDGYGPMNELEDWSPWDAQKSSANTNDLRGKILRIKPEPDGSYSIPAGNLFDPDGSQGRPEIYVMGCRNPYRISIDQKTGILYYGDVGPDAGEDSERGPRGYDEVNQVKAPGFFGWPYFVADNKAYAKYDYATGTIAEKFDPERPINSSPNNTGLNILPPAQPAMIYYPYAESKQFEGVGTGGRNAMAGPVFHADFYPFSKSSLPAYYDGKLFFYDWMRDWIKAATFDEDNNLLKYEPFLPEIEFHNIMDMTIAPDGSLYLLEYGSNWFAQNIDATLSRIDYAEGNRKPVAKFTADQLVGAAPLTVQFDASGSFDFDKEDELAFEWYFEDPGDAAGEGITATHTFTNPGIYRVMLKAIDQSDDYSTTSLELKVGNSVPDVAIEFDGNSSFYWDNVPISYQVKVNDQEDGVYPGGSIQAGNIDLSIDYISFGLDETMIDMGHRQKDNLLSGPSLIEKNNCFACHKINEQSIGPTYLQVAERYPETEENIQMLANKIIKGGNGNWGEQNMSAHPQISLEESTIIAKYVLSLNDQDVIPARALSGNYLPREHLETNTRGYYIFSASYMDQGGEKIGPMRKEVNVRFRSPEVEVENYDESSNIRVVRPAGTDVDLVESVGSMGYLVYKAIDFEQISSVEFTGMADSAGFYLELRQKSPEGLLVGKVEVPVSTESNQRSFIMPVESVPGGREDLYLIFKNEANNEGLSAVVDKMVFFRDSPMTRSQ